VGELLVRESKSATAEEALKLNVIDLIATNRQDLLRQLDGRTVGEKTLKTAAASVEEIPMTLREKVFQTLWRPEMMYVLMIIVILRDHRRVEQPRGGVAGVVGAISLVLLLFMMSALPFNAAGMVMIALAVVLFLIDAFAPTHGVLTAGGVMAFFLGSLMLFDRTDPFLRISFGLIVRPRW